MGRTLPDVIPLFPLPNVVHFPRILLPLHIFEPRYRALVRDALSGDRLIGMVLLRGEWQADYLGTPPIFETGTAGEIVRSEELPDGRFNIVLRGVREFRLRRELGRTRYREAEVEWRVEPAQPLPVSARERIAGLAEEFIRQRSGDAQVALTAPADDELFVNLLAQQLDLPVIEQQALLEADGLSQRGERLVEILEFHRETVRAGSLGSQRAQ